MKEEEIEKGDCGPPTRKVFFWFCRTWTKRYLITSQTRVKRVSRIHHRTILKVRMVRWCIRLTRLTLVCEVIRYRLVQVRQNQKKKKKKFTPDNQQVQAERFLSLLGLELCVLAWANCYQNFKKTYHMFLEVLKHISRFLLLKPASCDRVDSYIVQAVWSRGWHWWNIGEWRSLCVISISLLRKSRKRW